MILEKPDISLQDGLLTYRVNIRNDGDRKQLWFSVPVEFDYLISDLTDAAMVALLIPAMRRSEPIHAEGVVTERLMYNLKGPVQRVLSLLFSGLTSVNITADQVGASKERSSGVASGFSGGVDSYCLLDDYHYNSSENNLRLTHLLYNNVGSHGSGNKGRDLFKHRYLQMQPFAARTGLPFIRVDSNVDEFFDGFKFVDTHTLRNAAIAFLLQKGIGHYLYASSYSYIHLLPENLKNLHLADHLLLPLLGNDAMDIRTEGSEYTRLEKIRKLSGIADSYDALNVCVRDSENCSVCHKCMLTQFALEMAGCLELYRDSFNLELYRKQRKRYLADLLILETYTGSELRSAAKDKGIKFPISTRLLSKLLAIKRDLQKKSLFSL